MTVTVNAPADPEQLSVEVPDVPSVRLVDENAHVSPVEGDIEKVNLTLPVKPLIDDTVIVEGPNAPAFTVTLVGLAVTMKSRTFTVTVAV
jgi:hypothetical protein